MKCFDATEFASPGLHLPRAISSIATWRLDCANVEFALTLSYQNGRARPQGNGAFLGVGGEPCIVQFRHRRAARSSAAVIGNVLEWYDFAVYAYVAVYIAKNFLPAGRSSHRRLLAAFLTYGLGFVARPLGGIILGRVGDTHGRKTALLITIALMAVGTVLIGMLPTYASIGVAAPVVAADRTSDARVLGRRRMGLVDRLHRRMGAEGPARLLRQLPADERGRGPAARLRHRGAVRDHPDTGADGSVGVAYSVPARRHPGPGRPVDAAHDRRDAGLYQGKPAPARPHRPSRALGCLPARAFGFTIVWTVCFYVLLNYMPTWSRQYLKITPAAALWANTIGLFVLMVAIPVMGHALGRIRPQAVAAGVLHRLHRAALPDLQLPGRAARPTPS